MTVALTATGCGFGGSGDIESAGSWKRLPDPPLSPREHSIGISAGREVLILGGSDAPPTHPSAGSGPAEPRPPLRDGAVFDARTRAWRRIADAPIGLDVFSPGAVLRRTVYIAVRRTARRDTRVDLLAYRLRSDSWRRLPSPPRRNYSLVSAGGRLVAAGPARGPAPMSVCVLRRVVRRWERLPDAPFRGSLVWHRGRLVLIGFDPRARNPDNPALARAATLRLRDREWHRLPDSEHVMWGHGFWVPVGDRLVSPDLGTGNEDYDHGRPYGGILDPERGTWSELPNIPEPTEERGAEFGMACSREQGWWAGCPGYSSST